MKSRKIIISFLIALTAIAVLSGCGLKKKTQVENNQEIKSDQIDNGANEEKTVSGTNNLKEEDKKEDIANNPGLGFSVKEDVVSSVKIDSKWMEAQNLEEVDEDEGLVYLDVYNTGWEYFCNQSLKGEGLYYDLEKVTSVENDIIDDARWFEENNLPSPSVEYNFDEKYFYQYYQDMENYVENICIFENTEDGRCLYSINLYGFTIPDEYGDTDYPYVDEHISHAVLLDDVLYVSINHSTYASSAPHNAYVMAIDINSGSLLWKTEPLVSNAHNFDILGDTIFTGYGFTSEPDFIYLIDRTNGQVIKRHKVPTGPDYIFVRDNQLLVRTYDHDMVFNIIG